MEICSRSVRFDMILELGKGGCLPEFVKGFAQNHDID
jgi:hypothetical protein